MATAYKSTFMPLDLKLKERRHKLDKPAPVRVLVRDGVVLDSPETLTNPAEISIANRLKQEAPASERMLVPAMAAMGFSHSVPMFGYYLDFYNPRLKLCVEIDGYVHRGRRKQDRRRDASLRGAGIETHRFWARTVYNELDRVVHHIENLVALKTRA